MIPRKIFQLTTNNLSLNESIMANIEFLKMNNPGYTYKLMDELDQVNFLRRYYPNKYLDIYRSFAKGYDASKMDFFRYLLIYQFGGVYLDVKSSFLSPLDDLIQDPESMYLSHWPRHPESEFKNWGKHPELSAKGEYMNCVIIAPPGHPILRNVINRVVQNIENYKPSKNGAGGKAVLRLTGPVAYTLAVDEVITHAKYKLVNFFDYGFQVSVLGSSTNHLQLAKKNYGDQNTPIIKRNVISDSLGTLQVRFLKTYRVLKKQISKTFLK